MNEGAPMADERDVVAWIIEWPDGRKGRCPNDGPGARELVAARAMQGAKITEIRKPRSV